MLEEWKEMFSKCGRFGRRCSRSSGGMKGGVQEAVSNLNKVFKCAGGVEVGVQEVVEE